MIIYFIRHGESEATAMGDKAPAGHDLPLTSMGQQEAERVAKYFKDNGVMLDAVYSSTFVRAYQTALPTAELFGFQIAKDGRLRERDWGSMNNYTWPEVATTLKNMPLDARYRFVPEDGESWAQMEERVLAVMRDIMSKPTQNVAIFTHGGVLRGLMPVLAGVGKEHHENYTMDTGAISKFSTDTSSFEFVNLKP